VLYSIIEAQDVDFGGFYSDVLRRCVLPSLAEVHIRLEPPLGPAMGGIWGFIEALARVAAPVRYFGVRGATYEDVERFIEAVPSLEIVIAQDSYIGSSIFRRVVQGECGSRLKTLEFAVQRSWAGDLVELLEVRWAAEAGWRARVVEEGMGESEIPCEPLQRVVIFCEDEGGATGED